MQKIINPGSFKLGQISAPIFCKIAIEDGKLSISGVIAPLKSGNARGGCGQIDMEFQHRNVRDNDRRYTDLIKASDITFSKGWDAEIWFDFLDIWKQYHLNDMKAGCEHQRADGWEEDAKEEITIYHWKLKSEISKQQSELHAEAIERASSTEKNDLGFSPHEKEIMKLPYTTVTYHPELSAGGARYYEASETGLHGHKETQTRGWMRFSDHPAGVLGKPCPICKYEYGSAWKREELPEIVTKFLSALPETTKTPAWV